MLLQQILFEDSNFAVLMALLSMFSLGLGSHLIINTIMVSVYKESIKSYKYLHNFYINMMSILNTKHKIKVFKTII